MSDELIVVGLDVGTSGVRALAMNASGEVVSQGRCSFPPHTSRVEGGCVEQDPQQWRDAARVALRLLMQDLPSAAAIAGVSVDATSGTFLLADSQWRPLTWGIMYNDQRAVEDTPRVADAVREDLTPYGISIAPSFALTKIAFLARTQPKLIERCHRILHQTDWVLGMLCERYDVTDISTALKTGADPGKLDWPQGITSLGIPAKLLPDIVLPGTRVGEVTAAAAEATGLPRGTPVVAGCTDGTAGCLASGAGKPGDLNVTLGTTLVFKAISERPLMDPQRVLYNHRHPAGGYLPGAASSTGADWVQQHLPNADLQALGRDVEAKLPAPHLAYPLVKSGERFPFACPTASGFGLEQLDDPIHKFAAGMQGVAFLERMGMERLMELGLPVGPVIYATGGAVAGATWLKIRAAVNRRCYQVPKHPDCAAGAAVLAAMPSLGSCEAAVRAIVRSGQRVEPDEDLSDRYEEPFAAFVSQLRERGYL
jgi:sugar (pentulose or hexulose) kinase